MAWREAHEALLALGFTYVRRGKHAYLYRLGEEIVGLSTTTSDRRAYANTLAQARRIAGQRVSDHEGVRVRRPATPGRTPREEIVLEYGRRHFEDFDLTQARRTLTYCGSVSGAKRFLRDLARVARGEEQAA